MEYSDGSDDTEAGVSISANGSDLGAATYDADGDGVADSVIVGQDEYAVVVTDHDGDGRADEITAYDAEGNEVDPDDLPGESTESTDSGPMDETGTDTTTGTGGDDDGTSTGTGGSADPADGTGDSETDALSDPGTITVMDEQGRPVEVGEATIDWDGDGTEDTAVVQGDDGSTVGYTDLNGDGEADQITQISADRQVTIAVSDGNGGWEVVVTGHLNSSGELVEDDQPTTDGSEIGAPTIDEGQSLVGAGVPDSDAVAADAGAAGAAGAAITYTDASGQSYELGEPTADFDGDGTPDTVVTTLEDGTVVGYSDVDGDGLTDQVTQIDPDGTVTIGVPDGDGGWEQAATGRIGADGEFVPSA